MFLLNVKAMVVVVVTALIMFALLKPMFLRFIDPVDFDRRRIVWFIHAITAFIAPNIWLYLLVALPSLIWVASRDSNPIGLWFFLVFVVPPVNVLIPMPGIQTFFSISQERMLGLFLLLPMAIHYLHSSNVKRTSTMKAMDTLLLTYIVYQLALAYPYDSLTGQLRRLFSLFVDNFLVYFVFSRAITDKRRLNDAMAGLCLPAMVMAPLAVFESTRNWLLYTSIADVWGSTNEFAWLFRGDSLRSQLTTGHSIAMGYVMATALGFWLYLKEGAKGARLHWAAVPLLCAAIIVSYSRGAWILASMMAVLMFALAPRRSPAGAKALLGGGLVATVIYLSPLGNRIIAVLPFVGTASQDTVDYRQQLAEVSWQLVQQHPFFGNPFAGAQMESLRQGQGIIDMVNQYAGIAVFQGLVGLFLFAGFYVASVVGAYFHVRRVQDVSPDLGSAGAALVACMISTLVFIATVPGAWFTWGLAGVLAAFTGVVEHVYEPTTVRRDARVPASRYANS